MPTLLYVYDLHLAADHRGKRVEPWKCSCTKESSNQTWRVFAPCPSTPLLYTHYLLIMVPCNEDYALPLIIVAAIPKQNVNTGEGIERPHSTLLLSCCGLFCIFGLTCLSEKVY